LNLNPVFLGIFKAFPLPENTYEYKQDIVRTSHGICTLNQLYEDGWWNLIV
jgi:hypothetical protein